MLLKRSVVLALAAVLAMVVVACGGAENEEQGGGEQGGGEIAQAPGFDGQTIRLGVLSPLSGPVEVIGAPLTAGNEVWFERVNAEGGIAGQYPVELVRQDTQYVPDVTVQRYQQIKNDVAMFAQVLGTPPTNAVLPLLESDNIMAQPASLDSLWVREDNLLPVGGPYQIQAINAMDYYLSEEGGGSPDDTFCIMAQDDVYGEAGTEGMEFAAEQLDFEIAEIQTYTGGAEDVSGQIQQLRSANCDLVFAVSTPSDAGTIWGTAAQLEFAPQWIGQSPSWIDELAASELAPYLEENVWIVGEGTEWGDTSVPGMEQMLQDIEQYRPDQDPDYYFSFGYASAQAVTALLEKAVEMGDLSREGILAAAGELGTVSFGELFGDYEYGAGGGAENRNPPRTSTIFEVVEDKPFGLGTRAREYTSEAAQAFEFEAPEG